jgi:hypothetical protein
MSVSVFDLTNLSNMNNLVGQYLALRFRDSSAPDALWTSIELAGIFARKHKVSHGEFTMAISRQ